MDNNTIINAKTAQKIANIRATPREKQRETAEKYWLIM